MFKNEEEEKAKLDAKHAQDLADQQARNDELEKQLRECEERLNAISIPEKKRPKTAHANKVYAKARGADRWTNTFSRKTVDWDDNTQCLEMEKKIVGSGRISVIKKRAPSKRCCGNSPDKGHQEVSCYENQETPSPSKFRNLNRSNTSMSRLSVAKRSTSSVTRDLNIEGKCPKNYDWTKESDGWRCKGGKHFLSAKMSINISPSKRST
jgi:hypothetical protein